MNTSPVHTLSITPRNSIPADTGPSIFPSIIQGVGKSLAGEQKNPFKIHLEINLHTL